MVLGVGLGDEMLVCTEKGASFFFSFLLLLFFFYLSALSAYHLHLRVAIGSYLNCKRGKKGSTNLLAVMLLPCSGMNCL